MALLGLVGPAAALQAVGVLPRDAQWASKVFLECCAASNGRWPEQPPAPVEPRSARPARSRTPRGDRDPGRHRAGLFAADRPAHPTPPVLMCGGRRALAGEAPTTIWLDPPDTQEAQYLMGALFAMRQAGPPPPADPPGARGPSFRVRGLHPPPRAAPVDPPPSPTDSVPDPSPRPPRSPSRCRSQGTWDPGRAFLALTLATLASGVTRAGGSVPPGTLSVAPPLPHEADWRQSVRTLYAAQGRFAGHRESGARRPEMKV